MLGTAWAAYLQVANVVNSTDIENFHHCEKFFWTALFLGVQMWGLRQQNVPQSGGRQRDGEHVY